MLGWSDRTWYFEAVHITSGSKLQARLEETAADVVLFHEHTWTTPRLPHEFAGKSGVRPFRRLFRARSLKAPRAAAPALHAERASPPRTSVIWTRLWNGLRSTVKLKLVNAVLPGGLVVVSVYLTTAIGDSEQNIVFLNTLGQVSFIVGGDFNLAGEVREQSGWLHAVRARIVAPSNDTPVLGLDGQRQGYRFRRGFGGVAPLCQDGGSGRQAHSHTHSPAGRVGALRSMLAMAPTARGCSVICNMRRKICSL